MGHVGLGGLKRDLLNPSFAARRWGCNRVWFLGVLWCLWFFTLMIFDVCFYRIPGLVWNGFYSILHLIPSHETMEGWTKLQHGWQDAGRDVGTSRPKSQNSVLYCSSSAQPNCLAFHLLGAVGNPRLSSGDLSTWTHAVTVNEKSCNEDIVCRPKWYVWIPWMDFSNDIILTWPKSVSFLYGDVFVLSEVLMLFMMIIAFYFIAGG